MGAAATSLASPPTGSVPPPSRWAGIGRVADALGLPPGYLLAVALATVAVWGHHFPAGIDVSAHANIVRLWVEMGKGPLEYHTLYRTNLFTPYLVTYAIAYPFAKLFGALASIKVVLTLAALVAPWTMARWLRTIGGEPALGLVALPVIFGFQYVWGFLSYGLALGAVFGYLEAFERQGERPTWKQVALTMGWGLLLFFCHGLSFGVTVVCIVLRLVVRRRPLAIWRSALHLIPLGALTLLWLHHRVPTSPPPKNYFGFGRLLLLFSGFFEPLGKKGWAAVVVVALVVVWLVARPKLHRSLAAWVPFLATAIGFVAMPSFIGSTYQVAERLSLFVWAFAAGLLVAAPGREARLRLAVQGLVAASLVVLNVRLYRFNRELDGLREIATKMEPDGDIQDFMPDHPSGESEVFGFRGLSQTPSWISAATGALVENDYGTAPHMPVVRQQTRFPTRYRYIVTRADRPRVVQAFPDAELRGYSGRWFLYERKLLRVGPLAVVRSAQGWGDLMVDRSVDDTPLSVGGVAFDHGLGTHSPSFVRLRAPSGSVRLDGACGVDDTAADRSNVVCVIRSAAKVLWTSGVVSKGPPETFSVPLDETREVLLETSTTRNSINGAHADWVDLKGSR